MTEAVIYDGIRSPVGKHAGALSKIRPDELLAATIKGLVSRSDFDLSLLEDVICGDSNQAGEDCRNVARNAGLLAGLPLVVGGQTVNRLCGSGAAAVIDASRAIRCNEGNMFIAGGVESMRRAPWIMSKAESAYARDQQIQDSTIGWRFPNPRFYAEFGSETMPETADNIAKDLGISREDSDVFAAASQKKYADAKADGFYNEEILPIEAPGASRRAAPVATMPSVGLQIHLRDVHDAWLTLLGEVGVDIRLSSPVERITSWGFMIGEPSLPRNVLTPITGSSPLIFLCS